MPQSPANRQQNDGKQRRRHQAQLKREQGMFYGIAQQERETEEKQQDPQLRQRISLHKPAHQRRQYAAKDGWLFCRRGRSGNGVSPGHVGIRTPGVDRCGSVLHHWRGGLRRLRRYLSGTTLLKRFNALAKPGDLLPRRRAPIKANNRKHGRNHQRKNQ